MKLRIPMISNRISRIINFKHIETVFEFTPSVKEISWIAEGYPFDIRSDCCESDNGARLHHFHLYNDSSVHLVLGLSRFCFCLRVRLAISISVMTLPSIFSFDLPRNTLQHMTQYLLGSYIVSYTAGNAIT